MKYIHTTILFFLVSLLLVACTDIRKEQSLSSITITEICMEPDSGNAEWIELYNSSDKSTTLKGLFLLNEKRDTVKIPRITIAGKSCVVLALDTICDSLLPKENSFYIANTPNNFLDNGSVGSIALMVGESDTLDWVPWSDSATYRSLNDSEQVQFTNTVYTPETHLRAYHRYYEPGGTIARLYYSQDTVHSHFPEFDSTNWIEKALKRVHDKKTEGMTIDTSLIERTVFYEWKPLRSHEITPGRYDPLGQTLTPMLRFPHQGGYSPEDTVEFVRYLEYLPITYSLRNYKYAPSPPVWSFAKRAPAYTYQFGLFKDSTCVDTIALTPFSEERTLRVDSSHALDVGHTIYWRVRAKHANSRVGNWSETGTVTRYDEKMRQIFEMFN